MTDAQAWPSALKLFSFEQQLMMVFEEPISETASTTMKRPRLKDLITQWFICLLLIAQRRLLDLEQHFSTSIPLYGYPLFRSQVHLLRKSNQSAKKGLDTKASIIVIGNHTEDKTANDEMDDDDDGEFPA